MLVYQRVTSKKIQKEFNMLEFIDANHGKDKYIQWEISRILNWRYVSTIFLAIFCGYIPLHRPEF